MQSMRDAVAIPIGRLLLGCAMTAIFGGCSIDLPPERVLAPQGHPRGLVAVEQLGFAKQRATQVTAPYGGLLQALFLKTQELFSGPIPSVTDNGDGHRFATDPPGKGDLRDAEVATRVGSAVRDLGLRYHLEGGVEGPRAAERGLALLRAWTVDGARRMEPSAENHGPVTGNTAPEPGTELFVPMTTLLYGADLLHDYPGWRASDKLALVDWVRALGRSADGLGELPVPSDSWRVALIASAGALLSDPTLLEAATVRLRRLIEKLSPKGEVTNGGAPVDQLDAALVGLSGYVVAAEVLRRRGIDLYATPQGSRTLISALDYYSQFIADPTSFPGQVGPNVNFAIYEVARSAIGRRGGAPRYDAIAAHRGDPLLDPVLGMVTLTHADVGL